MAGIGIICKTPQAGVSKTRLHAVMSPDASAELAGCFLRDIAEAIGSLPKSVGTHGYAIYAPEGSESDLRRYIPADFGLVCRRDATLGVVLLGATTELLARGHDCALLVNADSPTLPAALLEQCITALRRPGDRVVLGPATDGGYYLIGLKSAHSHLFADVPWSTPAVLATTLARAAEIGLPVEMLPAWYDVDEAETLAVLLAELLEGVTPEACGRKPGGPAAATRAFVAAHPDMAATVRHGLAQAGHR